MTKNLFDYLEDLRVLLDKSGIERISGSRRDMGDNCYIYRRSRDVFLSKYHDQVKEALIRVIEQYRILNEKEFVTSPPKSEDL